MTTLVGLQDEVTNRYTEKRNVLFLAAALSSEAGKVLASLINSERADSGCYVDMKRGFDRLMERDRARDGLADVLFYAAALANRLGWDLDGLFQEKMRKNDIRYGETQ